MTATELALSFLRGSGKMDAAGRRRLRLFSKDYAAHTGLRYSFLPLTQKQAAFLSSLAAKRNSGWRQIAGGGYETRFAARVNFSLVWESRVDVLKIATSTQRESFHKEP